jgi:hypothetical protein
MYAHLPRNPNLFAFFLCFDPDLVAFFPRNPNLVAFPLCFIPDLVAFLSHTHLPRKFLFELIAFLTCLKKNVKFDV